MNRRELLAGICLAASGVASGCLGSRPSCTDGNWPPPVAVEEPSVSPGESTVFEITVTGITAFRFDTRLYTCGATDAPVRFGDLEKRPPIDAQADSCPPIWLWDDCTDVTLRVPVHVASDADAGVYDYGFHVAEDIDGRNEHDFEYSVTVSE
ncbi:hypothetical protein [Haloferax sp. DFSO52]|uniref:hypothetical protein n=1 Tax=Haloferax sp. DFSO52 TaxID=3388505 RepID=UPI003A862FA5